MSESKHAWFFAASWWYCVDEARQAARRLALGRLAGVGALAHAAAARACRCTP